MTRATALKQKKGNGLGVTFFFIGAFGATMAKGRLTRARAATNGTLRSPSLKNFTGVRASGGMTELLGRGGKV